MFLPQSGLRRLIKLRLVRHLKMKKKIVTKVRRLTSDMDNLHLTTSRQRELLELKDRQSIESDERERKTNLLIHSAQQLLKAEKEEVQILF
jgi:hypothetical protein